MAMTRTSLSHTPTLTLVLFVPTPIFEGISLMYFFSALLGRRSRLEVWQVDCRGAPRPLWSLCERPLLSTRKEDMIMRLTSINIIISRPYATWLEVLLGHPALLVSVNVVERLLRIGIRIKIDLIDNLLLQFLNLWE